MTRYSIELRTRKYLKSYEGFSFKRNLSNKYWKKLSDSAKTGLHAAKTASKILVYKTGKVTAALIGNKVLENIVTLKPVPEANSRNVEKIDSLPKKR